MKKSLVFLSLAALTTVLIWAGSCDPETEPPVDPCLSKQPYTGNFQILENVGDSLVETDTALQYGYITFKAPDDYDTYDWTIGTDPRSFTEKEVRLLFTEAEGRVDITLKSTKTQDPCFPDDPTELTITKSVYVVQWQYAPIIGKYAGYFESTPLVKDTIEIKYIPSYDEFGGITLININKGCMVDPEFPESSVWDFADKGARAFYFRSDGAHYNGCKSPKVWLRLINNDSIVSDFTFLNIENPNQQPPYTILYDKFNGKKINQ